MSARQDASLTNVEVLLPLPAAMEAVQNTSAQNSRTICSLPAVSKKGYALMAYALLLLPKSSMAKANEDRLPCVNKCCMRVHK
jgi:hypothetical protein